MGIVHVLSVAIVLVFDFHFVIFSALSSLFLVVSKQHQANAAGRGGAKMFANADTMLKEQLENITVEEYDVEKLYKKSGVMHRIAKDPFFNNGTLLIIFLNSLWIGSD